MKKAFKKVFSILLSVVLAFATFAVAAPAALAAAPTEVTFVVPEVIYLAPNATCNTASASLPFQWFVNNILTNGIITLENAEKSEGLLYFNYPTATTPTLEYAFVAEDGTEMSGGIVNLSGSTLSPNTAKPITSSTNAMKITAGTAPSFEASQFGAYIRWTVKFTDSADGLEKSVDAYTYVYKPFIAPVGVTLRTVNERGTDTYGSNISWISGVHGVADAANATYSTNMTNFIPFSNSSNKNGAVLCGDTTMPNAALYAQMPGNFAFSTVNNTSPLTFLYTGTDQLPKTMSYLYNDCGGSSMGDNAFFTLNYSPVAQLTVDSSRYTNLNQIPNLSLGMLVTDDEHSSTSGAWFVSNYTGTPLQTPIKDYERSKITIANGHWDRYLNNGTTIAQKGTILNPVPGAETEGVKFNSRWPLPLSSGNTTSTLMVATGYANKESSSFSSSDSIWNIAELRTRVVTVNKSILRSAVQQALRKSAILMGQKSVADEALWNKYEALLVASQKALTKLDASFPVVVAGTSYTSTDTLASALNNTVANISGMANAVTVIFNPNGGTFSGGTTSVITMSAGSKIPVSDIPTPTRNYDTFLGWATSASATSPDLAAGDEYTASSLATQILYAVWKVHEHTWNEGTVTREATCGVYGTLTKTCTVCSATETTIIPATGEHTENAGDVITAATCGKDGVKYFSCTVCGTKLRTEVIQATGEHTENAGVVTTAATCAKDGVKTFSCTVCSTKLRTEVIQATGEHTEDEGVVTIAPTCVTAGVKTFSCTVCDTVLRTEPIQATGEHSYDAVVVPATTTQGGYTRYTCTECGDSYDADFTDPLVPGVASFVVEAGSAHPGQDVEVAVKIQNNPGIVAALLNLSYDSSVLTLTKVDNGGLLNEKDMIGGKDLSAVPYRVLWLDAESRENYTDDGTLVVFTFHIDENAEPGETPITVTYAKNSTFDVDLNPLDFTVTNDKVSVVKRTPGDASGDGELDLRDVALLTRWLVGGWDIEVDEVNGDCDGDNMITLKDIALMRRYLAGWDVELV